MSCAINLDTKIATEFTTLTQLRRLCCRLTFTEWKLDNDRDVSCLGKNDAQITGTCRNLI